VLSGIGILDRIPDAGVEIGVPQRAPAPILQALVERGARSQILALGRVRKQLVLDQEFYQHAPPGSLRQGAQIAADLGLGEFHVGFGDGLAVDLGDDAVLGIGRQAAEQDTESGDRRPKPMRKAHVIPSLCCGVPCYWAQGYGADERGSPGSQPPKADYDCVGTVARPAGRPSFVDNGGGGPYLNMGPAGPASRKARLCAGSPISCT
jgi:hypothetical protein